MRQNVWKNVKCWRALKCQKSNYKSFNFISKNSSRTSEKLAKQSVILGCEISKWISLVNHAQQCSSAFQSSKDATVRWSSWIKGTARYQMYRRTSWGTRGAWKSCCWMRITFGICQRWGRSRLEDGHWVEKVMTSSKLLHVKAERAAACCWCVCVSVVRCCWNFWLSFFPFSLYFFIASPVHVYFKTSSVPFVQEESNRQQADTAT